MTVNVVFDAWVIDPLLALTDSQNFDEFVAAGNVSQGFMYDLNQMPRWVLVFGYNLDHTEVFDIVFDTIFDTSPDARKIQIQGRHKASCIVCIEGWQRLYLNNNMYQAHVGRTEKYDRSVQFTQAGDSI